MRAALAPTGVEHPVAHPQADDPVQRDSREDPAHQRYEQDEPPEAEDGVGVVPGEAEEGVGAGRDELHTGTVGADARAATDLRGDA